MIQNFFYLILLISVFLLSTCSNDNCSNPNNENHAPVVEEIIYQPLNPAINSQVRVTAIAVDKDGDELTYFFKVTGGEIHELEIGDNLVEWNTPDIQGEYTLTCTASDGKTTGSLSIIIHVQ